LAGQSLIHAAELRAVTTEYSRYFAATRAFRDKYFAIPGDMPNATSFWGIAGGTGSDATCQTTVSTDTKTCNGDGDGRVVTYSGSMEQYRFWQHLANAGLIEGTYKGVVDATIAVVPGQQAPGSKLSSAVWWLNNSGTQSGAAHLFDGSYNNIF